MTTFIKDPQAKLDYTVDWSDWLSGSEVIDASEWTVPSDLTTVTSAYGNETATVWVSGGKVGRTYIIKNKITTDANPTRIDERSFTLEIRNK